MPTSNYTERYYGRQYGGNFKGEKYQRGKKQDGGNFKGKKHQRGKTKGVFLENFLEWVVGVKVKANPSI